MARIEIEVLDYFLRTIVLPKQTSERFALFVKSPTEVEKELLVRFAGEPWLRPASAFIERATGGFHVKEDDAIHGSMVSWNSFEVLGNSEFRCRIIVYSGPLADATWVVRGVWQQGRVRVLDLYHDDFIIAEGSERQPNQALQTTPMARSEI